MKRGGKVPPRTTPTIPIGVPMALAVLRSSFDRNLSGNNAEKFTKNTELKVSYKQVENKSHAKRIQAPDTESTFGGVKIKR